MNPSKPRLKILGGRERQENPYLKRMCYMLWSEILIPIYRRLPLQPEELKKLSIVYYRANFYISFIYTECSYYHQITHHVSCLHSDLLTKVWQTCTLPVPCCSYSKEATFHVKGCLMHCKNFPKRYAWLSVTFLGFISF